jgi:hypothetical protein
MKGEVVRKFVTPEEFPRKTLVLLQEYHAHDPFVGFGFSSNGPVYLVFCRLYLSSTSHHGRVWLLPVISLLLTNTVSPVRACLSI